MIKGMAFGRGLLAVLAYLLFAVATNYIRSQPVQTVEMDGSVVLPPPLQTILYFGDPFLAANIESSRILATGGDLKGVLGDYYNRLHPTIAQLNPCHEDNYYIANAFLAWAGGVEPAIQILSKATQCRFWDEVPPFFLGYNLYFFKQDYAGAKAELDKAADRSTDNRIGFRKMGIMFGSGAYPDTKAARNYLALQREQASDPKLRAMLDQRIARLEGLILLRDAQSTFQQRFGKTLENPMDLITSGMLKQFPSDPMRLGYEFTEGRFSLKELKIRGMEKVRK
jgi:tetratricopeptide (TPR) repeat protein